MFLRWCRPLAAALPIIAALHLQPAASQTNFNGGGPAPAPAAGGSSGRGGLAAGALIGVGIAAGVLILGATTRPVPARADIPPPGRGEPVFAPPPRAHPPRVLRPRPPRVAVQNVPPRPGFGVPAPSERRYVPDEILVSLQTTPGPAQLRRFERRYRLTPLAAAHIDLLNLDIRRYRIPAGASVPRLIAALRGAPVFVAAVQPNFVFELQDAASRPAATPAALPDKPPQYAVAALKAEDAHKISSGTNVLIAVIDTGLDETNPEFEGAVAARFDAIGGDFVPLAHGTAMGGVIVAHKNLTGIAPGARLMAIRAFSNQNAGPNGTGFDVLRGLDYAASHGARIVNMSFAGPEDMLLHQALDAARRKGIIAVAAAGNAGPDSKPLFPAAQAGVLAVTATDASGKIFVKANRGSYVSVAAPGASVIAPGLAGGVQLTSGTSVAAAQVSGIVALLLQLKGTASPDDVAKILRATAHPLAPDQPGAGAGLADASAAVSAIHP